MLEKFQSDTEKAALMQESYSKRMNILIHVIEEDNNSVWESHKQTTERFENFLEDALKMNPDNIEVVDIHRLPQQPIFEKGIKVNRAIIVKLTNAIDKSTIFGNLKLPKDLDNAQKLKNKPFIYITDHLPRTFLQQKKMLLPDFKHAKRNKQKTSWRAEDGEYVLYVEGRKISSRQNQKAEGHY